jgi:hypothetical protein
MTTTSRSEQKPDVVIMYLAEHASIFQTKYQNQSSSDISDDDFISIFPITHFFTDELKV